MKTTLTGKSEEKSNKFCGEIDDQTRVLYKSNEIELEFVSSEKQDTNNQNNIRKFQMYYREGINILLIRYLLWKKV